MKDDQQGRGPRLHQVDITPPTKYQSIGAERYIAEDE